MPVLLRQSHRSELIHPETFLWCTGIEDTFITAPWPKTGRTLDEYELTQHYERWHEDIGLMKQIGVDSARYGLPWHQINPRPNVWDFDWADRAVERLLELGIQPIIDLVHYGLPSWIESAYAHPEFPEYMAEYAGRVAERYRGRVFAYTPLNEPRITAWFCGRIGWWPPFGRSWRGFVQVMHAVARGTVRTVETLHSIDPEILPVHVDATDLYQPIGDEQNAEAKFRQQLVFLALDLVSGRIDEKHQLFHWLRKHGMTEADFAWFREHGVELPLVGINLYPMFTYKELSRTAQGRLRVRMPYANGELIDRLTKQYWERYRAPIFISETASVGSVKRRLQWLHDSLAATRRVRTSGIPLVGYTWWPLFALVTWAYRQGEKPPESYLKQMGLWDLTQDLTRMPTQLVNSFFEYSRHGAEKVGALSLPGAVSLPSGF
ncbi:MAG TPA: family 1 glycosylhydrolase [Opitutaceae bacterium]